MQDKQNKDNQSQSWQCVHTFTGHTSWVYGVPITSEGQTLASVSYDQIKIWDLNTGELSRTLTGHSDIIFSLAISPSGQTIASGSADKTVKVWNLQTGELLCTLSKRKDQIYSVAFSRDGKILASGGATPYRSTEGKTTTIYLWNLDTGELIRTLSGHTLRVNCVAFSPDGHILASGSNDKTIKIWNLNTGEPIHTLTGHSGKVNCVAISLDGNTLVSSGDNGIKIWDLATGELLRSLSEDLEYVGSFTISPDGQTLASDAYSIIKIWNLSTGELIHTLEFLWPVSLAFSPDGKLLASGSAAGGDTEGIVKIWRVPSGLKKENAQQKRISELSARQENVQVNSQDTDRLSLLDTRLVYEPTDSPRRDIDKLATDQERVDAEGYFNPENIEDARKRISTSIVQRQGQPKFRRDLLEAYNGRCAITGCDAEQALEAAHIIPYLGPDTNHPSNGLLLRADIHTLFDLYLVTVDPETMKVRIDPSLAKTCYGELDGRHLQLPNYDPFQPNKQALEQHHLFFLRKQNGV